MSMVAFHALSIAAVLALLLEIFGRQVFGPPVRGRSPRPTLAVSAMLTLAIMWALGPGVYTTVESGAPWGLGAVLAGSMVLFGAGLKTDYDRPGSRRHLMGTVAAGLVLCLGGLGAPYLGVPGSGIMSLGWLMGGVFTVLWVFLIVGLVEILCLVPLLSSLLCLALGGVALFPAGIYATFPGLVLGGTLGGIVMGRFAGQFLLGRAAPMPKADSLTIGFLIGATTLTLFIKSMTFAGLVIPLGVATVILLAVLVQGFDRTLILRASPRE